MQDERQAVIYWAFIHNFDYIDPDINGSDFALYNSRMDDCTYERFREEYYQKNRHVSPDIVDTSINPLSPEAVRQFFSSGYDDSDDDE